MLLIYLMVIILDEIVDSDTLLIAVGKTTNHCLVMAQLYTQGKNCGIHMFMVQIRDLETHMPLAGW